MDIYGLGNALVDSEYVVTEDALENLGIQKGIQELIDETQLVHILSTMSRNDEYGGELHKQASGGSAGNTIMAAQNFGAQCAYACRVADDPIGHLFCEDMTNGGVQIDESIAIMEQGHSGQCVVMITKDGERTLNTYLGVSSDLSIDNINQAQLQSADLLYLEGFMAALENSIKAACYAKSTIQAVGGRVVLSFSDPSMTRFCREGLETIINHGKSGVDILLCNEEEALTYTGRDTLSAALEELAQISSNVVITLGAKGALALVNGERYEVPTKRVEVLNTNGAGDAFAGAYIYGISQGWSIDKTIALANATARIVVTQYGPRLNYETQQALVQSFNI